VLFTVKWNKIEFMEIILVSGSYKRKEILEKAKISFKVVVPEVDESLFDNLSVKERVQKVAQAKARAVFKNYPEALIIAADTMDEDNLKRCRTKPKNMEEGLKMAMEYSGSSTICYTGVCMIHPKFGEVLEVAKTEIKMQEFSKGELKRLVDDKFLLRAGALGISEETAGYTLVQSVSGSHTGYAGLPMEIVRKYLKAWKVI